VRRVTAANPGPFTFTGTNTFLVGEQRLAIIDPGPDDPSHVEALIRAIGDAKVAAIVVTHTHRDHSPAARALKRRYDVPVYAAGRSTASRPARPGEIWLDVSADVEFAPDVVLADGDVIAAGDTRLETILTPGHTANHAAFALAGHGFVFSGDHVMGWSTSIVAPPEGSMAAYMASLDRLLARPEQQLLPAHGPPILDAHHYIRALRDHRLSREAAILAALEHGPSDIPELVAHIYLGLAPALKGAAALSVFAHLEDLVARGLVATDGETLLGGHYRLAEATPPGAFGSG
jgi:glyoxylase-like metal-dependent hydrolase (beta-lactamase superfamily II)